MNHYRTNAKPECPCDCCQSSVWQRQIAYVVQVFPRIFGIAVVGTAGLGAFLCLIAGIGRSLDTPAACQEEIGIVDFSSTPFRCRAGSRMLVLPGPDLVRQREIRCLCPESMPTAPRTIPCPQPLLGAFDAGADADR